MPFTRPPRIKTDIGVYKTGYAYENDEGDYICGITSGTDVFSFFGLSVIPKETLTSSPSTVYDIPHKTATLNNGSTMTVGNYAYSSRGRISYILKYEFRQSSGANKTGEAYYKDPGDKTTSIPALMLSTNPDRYVTFFSYPASPDYSKPMVVGQKVYSNSGMPKAFYTEWIGTSVAPDFPGPDNENDPEGGDGDGEIEDDPIEAPEDPGIAAVDSGLLTLYVPSLTNIHEFGNFLWSDLFSLDTFKKLFADPMEAVIGISVLPIAVPHSAGAESITIGQIESGVFAPLASKQFVKHDCGSIKINPVWNTALDYDPYTHFSIYLPYIGTRDLKTDDIMNKELNVSYLIDILSGSCTAHIKVGGSVLYQFSGSCAVPIPLSGTSWTNLLTSSIQLAGTGIAAAMTAGASTVVSAAATGMAVAGTAGLVSASKQAIQRTGAVSGAAGMLGVQTPYLIRETPRQSLAKDYNKFVGYPSNITSKLSELKGFTQVEHIHLENLSCTDDEAAEIESLLKEGVII